MASTALSRCPGALLLRPEHEALAPRTSLRFAGGVPTPASSAAAAATSLKPLPQASQRTSARVMALAEDLSEAADVAPPQGTKLYVGNLPWNVDSATLADIFQDAGVVEEVEVVCDRDTGRSRGFAFVVMSSPEDAQAAIERFDGSDLGGRTLRVNFPSPPGQRTPRGPGGAGGQFQGRGGRARGGDGQREENPNKLYVGNLSWGVDDLALQELFADFGKVLEARVVTDRDTGRSRGFGFVTLSNQDEVSQAVNNLDGAEFDGRQLKVNPASQKPKA